MWDTSHKTLGRETTNKLEVSRQQRTPANLRRSAVQQRLKSGIWRGAPPLDPSPRAPTSRPMPSYFLYPSLFLRFFVAPWLLSLCPPVSLRSFVLAFFFPFLFCFVLCSLASFLLAFFPSFLLCVFFIFCFSSPPFPPFLLFFCLSFVLVSSSYTFGRHLFCIFATLKLPTRRAPYCCTNCMLQHRGQPNCAPEK